MLLYLKIDEKIFEAPSIEFLARRKAVISNEFPNSLLAELLSLKDSILLFFLFLLFFLSSLEKMKGQMKIFETSAIFPSWIAASNRQLSRGIRLRMALVVGEAWDGVESRAIIGSNFCLSSCHARNRVFSAPRKILSIFYSISSIRFDWTAGWIIVFPTWSVVKISRWSAIF